MTNNKPLILHFSDIRATDLPLVGGKGANLGEMTHAGFPVPPGFCLTTYAYQQFMATCPDADRLYVLLDTVTPGDVEAVRRVGQQVRQTLLEVPIPATISEAALQAMQEVGVEYAYAVRSSSTAEDLPDASFAGQQDTYLNIIGEIALLDAIQRCWVSLFTDRAILYRVQNGFNHREVQLSVVVQQMVLSERSGTLFTADPLTGRRSTTSIDASFGLGEALVSGLVSPDNYKVDKRTQTILERHVADKKIAIYPVKEGGTRQENLDKLQQLQTILTDPQIMELAQMAARVEEYYQAPQDIEWGMVGSSFYLLQSRPITSLYPIDGLGSPDDSLHVFLSLGHQQSMTRAMSPLGLSNIQVVMPIGHAESVFDNKYIRASGGRMFADLTLPLRHPILRKAMFALLGQLDALAPEAARQVMQRLEFKYPHSIHLTVAALKGVLGIVRRVISALFSRDLTGFVDKTNALMDEYISGVTRSLQAIPPGKGQLQAVLDVLPDFFPFFLNWVPETAAGMAAARMLPRLAARWLTQEETEALTLGIPGNVVNEMNLAIGDLADMVSDFPKIRALFKYLGENGNQFIQQVAQQTGSNSFMAAWGDFLSRYGSRGPSEIDISKPRWYEDPLPVLRVVAEFLNSEQGRHHTLHNSLVAGRQAAIQKLRHAAGAGLFGRLCLRLIERLYHAMTEAGGMREHHKFMVIRLFAVVKEVLITTASQLVAAKKLGQPDDIWFLTWAELFSIWDDNCTDWGGLVARRRAELKRFDKLTPSIIITSDGEAPAVRYQVKDAPEGALLGNPVAPGLVEGVVHVIHDPQSESLASGEVLVAEFTDPGWTPLFINASGLILEVGGALTHGAVVAREYGIPAIVGVRDATTILQTGQRVRLDGNRGIIEIL